MITPSSAPSADTILAVIDHAVIGHDERDHNQTEYGRRRAQLRTEMRSRRRRVTDREQAAAAQALGSVVLRHGLLRRGMRVAVYQAHGREADLSRVIAIARRRECVLYLPAIIRHRAGLMDFVRFDADTPLLPNAFGIHEPDLAAGKRIPLRELDLILVPLLAVDTDGWRLGSGGGFYDRRLHRLRAERRWRRPRLVGVAYEFQRIAHLDHESWDVPLDAVITESNLYPIPRRSSR
jgi:5-formyltetrahydrofolate cyclo-ligase